jgi:Skp family chaperone for outer membrane proteins
MKTNIKLMLASAMIAPVALFAALPATAQAVAVADPEGAIAASKAFVAANTQIQATFKASLDQAQARRAAIQAELQPLYTVLDTNHDGQLSQPEIDAANQAKRPELASIQAKQAAAQAELSRLEGPATRAQQYAVEQISAKLQQAITAAMAKRGTNVLLKPAAVFTAQGQGDLTPAITAELDTLVPSVSTTPPANWQPGQQQAAPGTAPTVQTPPAAPGRRPQGR